MLLILKFTKLHLKIAFQELYKMKNFETRIAFFKILSNNKIQKKYKTQYQHLFQDKIFKELLGIKSYRIINLCEIDKKNKTIIYEYFISVNLRERLKSHQKISYKDLIHILKQMALSIDFLHKNNIVHIDINDTNFLINDNLEIKLNDYDFIEMLHARNQDLKKIDILAFALIIYRIIQLPYQWNAIRDLEFNYNNNDLDYSSCEFFLNSLKIEEKIIFKKEATIND